MFQLSAGSTFHFREVPHCWDAPHAYWVFPTRGWWTSLLQASCRCDRKGFQVSSIRYAISKSQPQNGERSKWRLNDARLTKLMISVLIFKDINSAVDFDLLCNLISGCFISGCCSFQAYQFADSLQLSDCPWHCGFRVSQVFRARHRWSNDYGSNFKAWLPTIADVD